MSPAIEVEGRLNLPPRDRGHSTDKQLKVSKLTGSNDYRELSVFIIGDPLVTNKIRTIKLAKAIILSSSSNDFLSFKPVFRGFNEPTSPTNI